MNNITVLLLAGGDSSRFWPLSDKNTLSFLGKPLSYFCLSQLNRFGFKNILIVVNQHNKEIFSRLKPQFPQMKIELINQTDQRGMAGAVISASKYLAGEKLLIISPSDIYEDILLDDFRKMLNNDPDGIIAGISSDKYFPGGYLSVENDKVMGIVEKPLETGVPSKIVNLVFHYIKNSNVLLDHLNKIKTKGNDLYEQTLDYLMRNDLSFRLLTYKGYWGYLKYPWHTLNLSSYFLSKITGKHINNVSIAESAITSGDVFCEDNVRILENAKILGPCYIGRGTIIGNSAIIRGSMIGSNCVVGYSTEITRSYVGDNCWFHSNYIGDSVISENVSLGAGTVLANLKLDETNINSRLLEKKIDTGKQKLGAMIGSSASLGVNCSVMPGIKIGQNSFLGAGVVLDRDLMQDKFCKAVQTQVTITNKKVSKSEKFRRDQKNLLEKI